LIIGDTKRFAIESETLQAYREPGQNGPSNADRSGDPLGRDDHRRRALIENAPDLRGAEAGEAKKPSSAHSQIDPNEAPRSR
jgi:hypothetical protein